MAKKLSLFKREPAMLIGTVVSIVGFLATFGILGGDKADAIKGLLLALIPLLGAFATRQNVTSPAGVAKVAVETAAQVTAGPPTELSTGAVSAATKVVADSLGTTVDVAGDLVGSALEGAGKLVKGVL